MRLEGVIAATVTPFRKDGVNYEALRDLLARLASQGYGLFPSSSTGEVAKLCLLYTSRWPSWRWRWGAARCP
jgi:Dihydrodipicolinate synthase/N-acetylneuraminate lyase